MAHIFLIEIPYINQFVTSKDRKKIKRIGFYLEQKITSLEELAKFLDLFVGGLENERSSAEIEFKKARLWYLNNLARVLRGIPLDPRYDIIFDIEDIFEKYAFVIDYLVQLTTISQESDQLKKIVEILKDILMFDIYLTKSSESNYDLPELFYQQICEEDPRDPYTI